MIKLETSNLDTLIKDHQKKLKDLENTKYWKTEIKADNSFRVRGSTFNIDAQNLGSIQLFNNKNDKDDDGIIGKDLEDDGMDNEILKLKPQIVLNDQNVWLKYSFKAGVSGGLSAGIANVDGEKHAALNSYLIHKPEEIIKQAVQTDLSKFKVAVNQRDVIDLKKGEALSLQVAGKLEGKINVKWSDILSGILGKLSVKILSGEVVNLKINDSISNTFNWEIGDSFTIVFSRPTDKNGIRVGVKKANHKKIGATTALSIGVSLSGDLAKIAKKIKENLIDHNLDEVKNILDQISLENTIDKIEFLKDKEKNILIKVMDRLGLDWVKDKVKLLKEKLDNIEKEISDEKIEEMAKKRVEFSLSYDYSRIDEETTLFQAILTEDALMHYHNRLVNRKLTDLLGDNNAQISLERYMKEKIKKEQKASSFSLGIGKWAVAAKAEKKLEEVTRLKTGNRKQKSFLGTRTYEDKLGDRKIFSTVDFKAQMDKFSEKETPLASEFKYGFSFLWKWDWKSKKDILKNLPMVVDHAAIWRTGNHDSGLDDKDLSKEIEKLLNKKEDIEIKCQLDFDHFAFKLLLPELTEKNEDRFAQALGAAVPYVGGFEIRESYDLRQRVYAELWKEYLKEDGYNAQEMSEKARDQIRKGKSRKSRSLAHWEALKPGQTLFSPGSIANLVEKKEINFYWNRFRTGMKLLQDAISGDTTDDAVSVIREAWEKANEFWDVPFLARTFGVYLLMLSEEIAKAKPQAEIWQHIERSLKISYAKKMANGKKKRGSFIITKSL